MSLPIGITTDAVRLPYGSAGNRSSPLICNFRLNVDPLGREVIRLTNARMTIIPLADRPEVVPLLARWFHDEWFCFDGRSLPSIEVQLAENLGRDCIPITFLAQHRSEVVGTVSLDLSDLPQFDHLLPWLASLYIVPTARDAGIGTALVLHAQQFATFHGISRLYLWTAGPTRLYEKCGWTVFQRADYNSHPITLMHLGSA
jgi:GNAT superfamily N-acetyltransferase